MCRTLIVETNDGFPFQRRKMTSRTTAGVKLVEISLFLFKLKHRP